MIKGVLAVFLVLTQGTLAGAQATIDKTVAPPIPSIPQPLPFDVGEQLVYEVGFSKLIFSGTIGELTLSVPKPTDGAPGLLQLRADAVSKGFFPKLFGIKVKDRFSSLVNPSDFGLHTSTKLLHEGKVRREQLSVIDRQAGQVTFTDRDLANSKAKPATKVAPAPTWIQDVLSAIYFVRTQPLKEGDAIQIPISDGGAVYTIEVVVGKREEIKVRAGRFKAIQLDAKIFDGRYIRRSGEMKVWISDNAQRVPLRAKVKTSGVTITVGLKRLQTAPPNAESSTQKQP